MPCTRVSVCVCVLYVRLNQAKRRHTPGQGFDHYFGMHRTEKNRFDMACCKKKSS